MCKGQKGVRGKGGAGGLGAACLGEGCPHSRTQPSIPWGLSFGGGGAASPAQVLPTLGPASSTGEFCWEGCGGQVAPQPWSCGVPGACAAGEPRRELLERRARGHSPVPHWAMPGHGPATARALSAQRMGVPGAAPLSCQTPLSTYTSSPHKNGYCGNTPGWLLSQRSRWTGMG